ncbi:MAG: thermonuclease family protein [Chloroflexota bacterium]
MRRIALVIAIIVVLIAGLSRAGILDTDNPFEPLDSFVSPSPTPLAAGPSPPESQPEDPLADIMPDNILLLETQRLPYAKVSRVVDGDTIVIQGGQRVRYIGIDAPEARGEPQAFGQQATEVNRSLVEGKLVRLEKDVSETDKYGRLLRYVYVNGTFVNAELVQRGYARAVSYPPDVRYQDYFRALEREAREAVRGLWGG